MSRDFEVQIHAGDERIADLLNAKPLPDGSQGGGLWFEAHRIDDMEILEFTECILLRGTMHLVGRQNK